jgi:ABC-type multidrug transport system, ATPase component
MRALSIRNLQKTYRNGTEALKGINLDVEEGDFFALLGPNGAGKSTIIGIISSLVNKSAGSVCIFDADLARETSKAKSYLGVVPQEFNFNVFETVFQIVVNQAGYYGIDRKTACRRAEACLEQVGLLNRRNAQARTLSGGLKRRLMIARALVHGPRLLILDEPTAGIDIELRRLVWDFLRTLNREGTTIILTTHYLEEAESLCRNVAIINQGRIIENTGVKELLRALETEIFLLDVKGNIDQVPEFKNFRVSLADHSTLEVEVSKKHNINELFAEMDAQGIHVTSMRNKSNRLEALFLKLVGVPQK